MSKGTSFLSFSIFFLALVLLFNFLADIGLFNNVNYLKPAYAAPPEDVKGSINVAVDAFVFRGNLLLGMADGSLKIYTPDRGLQPYIAPASESNQSNYFNPLCASHNPSLSPFVVGSDRRVYRRGPGGFIPVSKSIP